MDLIRGSTTIEADRHEVSYGDLWDEASGSDFFMEPSASQVSGTGNAQDLSDRGWTTTGLAFVGPTKSASFLDATDLGVPGHFEGDNAGDILQSPALFGDFIHGQQAAHHLGFDPTTLTFEAHARFSITSASETGTALGFVDADGSIITEADHIAAIHTDGTNFILRSAAPDTDVGALDDELEHLFTIVVSIGSVTDAIEWFIDGTSQGTIDRLADVWPASVGWGNQGAGTNRIQIGSARVFYR